MVTTAEMLEEARRHGAEFRLAEGTLRVKRGAAPAELLDRLRERKDKVVDLLRSGAPVGQASSTPSGTPKAESQSKAEDEALRRLRAALTELRPYLPKGLAQLPDDKLLALVNWSIMAAWTRMVEGMPR